jgi:triosephosphate isomerase (TIM)
MRSAPGPSGRRRLSPTEPAPLGEPLLLINLKSYPGALGLGALKIGRTLERLGRHARIPVAIAPAPTDVGHLAQVLSIPVLAQHVDPFEAGARTGYVAPEALARAGARGSLINHSEHPLPEATTGEAVGWLERLDLVPVVCANSAATARRLARFHPPYLAVEPPELIGGDRSVATARPEVITDTVRAVHQVSPETRVLCGAGVHDRRDVEIALRLGSRGLLVASAVANARDPAGAIRELLRGFA